MKSPFLTVVVPAFNEEHRIQPTLRQIHEYLSGKPYLSEIIVVDNASKDRTAGVVKALRETIPNLRLVEADGLYGKGYAIAAGMRRSLGQYVLFSDADLSTPIEEAWKLVDCLERGADVAIGSRNLKKSEILVRQTWLRQMAGKIFSLLVRTVVMRGIADTQCGFKCFKRETVEPIFSRQRIYDFGFDVEALWVARKLGYKIAEVPIRWIDDARTHVRPVKDGLLMFVDLIKIRINDARGAYD